MQHDRRRRTYGDWMVGIDWRSLGLAVWFCAGVVLVGCAGGSLLARALLP